MYDNSMNTRSTRPATFNHSAARVYVAKLVEYANSVAGQGKQHVGVPGRRSIGAQNRPRRTSRYVSETSHTGATNTYSHLR